MERPVSPEDLLLQVIVGETGILLFKPPLLVSHAQIYFLEPVRDQARELIRSQDFQRGLHQFGWEKVKDQLESACILYQDCRSQRAETQATAAPSLFDQRCGSASQWRPCHLGQGCAHPRP